MQPGRKVILEGDARHRSVLDALRVEDVQDGLIRARVVDHHRHPPVVLRLPARLGAKDGLLHEAPLTKVPALFARLGPDRGVGVELDEHLVGTPLHVVLHRRRRRVRVPVRFARVAVVHLRELHHAVGQRRLRGGALDDVHVEAGVFHARAAVVEGRGDHVEVHREIHKLPGRRVEDDARRVLALLGLVRVDVVKEELVVHGDGLLSDLPRLVRPREHVQGGGLTVLEPDHLGQRALGEHVLGEELTRVQRRGVLQEQVPVFRHQTIVEHAEGGVRHPERVSRRAFAVGVPLVEAALIGLERLVLGLDGEGDEPALRGVRGVQHAVVRRHLRHLQVFPQHGVRLTLGAKGLRVHLVGLPALPQRVELPGPVDDAGVGDVLDVKVKRVVEGVALGVADGKRSLVQHLSRRLLVGEALGTDEVVLEGELAVLERDAVHESVAVEELIEALAEDLEEARAVAEEGAVELLGNLALHAVL